ncbi:protein of unknown function [Candidatus Methylocalor cossyra]|uniref:Uncharacterized protein n=1 Tax=Candidatus Methylocalor cossyra TaxID=3108543 RepID=A0ABM9NKQ3_9GAMM
MCSISHIIFDVYLIIIYIDRHQGINKSSHNTLPSLNLYFPILKTYFYTLGNFYWIFGNSGHSTTRQSRAHHRTPITSPPSLLFFASRSLIIPCEVEIIAVPSPLSTDGRSSTDL